MPQKLILPVNKCKLTASMKTDSYFNKYGFVHYGIDMASTAGDRTLWPSGDGTVIAAGRDNVVGNVVAVLYPDALNHRTGKVQDVVFRYYHLESIAVKVGQTVNTKDTKIGVYGNTGSMSMPLHLHVEADTDTANPLHSPTVLNSNLLKGRAAPSYANDRTMSSPLDWLHRKTDAPDNQTYITAEDIYIKAEDKTIPQITGALASTGIHIEGIDVSRHNGAVDFKKVAAAGKKFVFVRVGWAGWDGPIERNNGLDKLFHENMKAAIAAGLQVGVYVYSYCKTPEAARIAAHETLELVKPYVLDYPIAFDIEDTSDAGTRYDKMSKADNSAICAAFLSTIQRSGYYGLLYTYTSFAQNYLDMTALPEWDVWIAQYANSVTYKGTYGIWQYKGDVAGFVGSCPGVTGACDLNVAYKDYAALIAAAGLNRPDAPMQESSDMAWLLEEKRKLQQDVIDLNARISALEAKLRQINQLSA